MTKKIKKTLIEKLLEKEKIPFTSYSFKTHLQGDVYAINEKLDDSLEKIVFKTLVVSGNKTGPIVGVIPIDKRLDYKKLSKVSGNKKIGLVPLKDLVKTSGYLHGANTPIGIYHNKHYQIYYDALIQSFDEIIVSAGEIGKMLKINSDDLIKITQGEVSDIVEGDTNV